MVQAFYFLGSIVLLFGAVLLGLRIVEFIRKWKSDRYQTNTHKFLHDLYKLQTFWAGKGEIGFVESVGNLIKTYGTIDKKPSAPPLTNEGYAREKVLMNNFFTEMENKLEEFKTEFVD